jgi:hypothetical protein
MKLVMTLLVRDEADIIGENITFHLAHGVDHFIATDNLSEDATPDILRDFERQGVLHYIRQTEDDYAQYRWVTHMARLACTAFGADWVINNDADEFWMPHAGDLKQALAGAPAGCDALAVPRVNFPPRPARSDGFFAQEMIWRDRVSLNPLGQPLPGKVCHRAFADIEVSQGNHLVYRLGQALPSQPAPITIFHFPMRRYDQFANKIIKGGAAYARNRELPLAIGGTWRQLYGRYLEGGLPAFWEQSLLTDAAAESRLRVGSIVRDDRLAQFFARRRLDGGS